MEDEKIERRGAKKGERRGGRQKGTLNKRTLLFETAREACEKKGYSPIDTLIEIARNKKNDPGVRGRAAAELCTYLYAKRKAIEHSGPGGYPIELSHSLHTASAALDRINGELSRLASGGSQAPDTEEASS